MTRNRKELPPLPSPSRSSSLNTKMRSPTTVITDITNGNDSNYNLLETDYDTAPSVLYRCLEAKNHQETLKRCRKYPQEASVVVSRRDGGGNIRWRQLPLHAAFIFRAKKEVIAELIHIYPQGCSFKDDQGMLPLHLAFRYNASESVINLLLKIYPEGIRVIDAKGRYPVYLARSSKMNESNTNSKVLTMRTYLAFLVSWANKVKKSSQINLDAITDENSSFPRTIGEDSCSDDLENISVASDDNSILREAIIETNVQASEIESLSAENAEKDAELNMLRERLRLLELDAQNAYAQSEKRQEDQLKTEVRLNKCLSARQSLKDAHSIELEVYREKIENLKESLKESKKDVKEKEEKIQELERLSSSKEGFQIMQRQLEAERTKNAMIIAKVKVFEATEKKLMNRIYALTDSLIKADIDKKSNLREQSSN